jgi:competence protein ComEA
MKLILVILYALVAGLASADMFSFSKSVPSVQTLAPKTKSVASTTPSSSTNKVNINAADAQGLANLKGVGAKKAQAIISYRQSHGPFNSLDQFELVPGIGPSLIEKNKDIIVFK